VIIGSSSMFAQKAVSDIKKNNNKKEIIKLKKYCLFKIKSPYLKVYFNIIK